MIAADPIISISDLKKTYGDGWFNRRRIQALNGVSFDVHRGGIFGLLGPNGAGKTTLIKVLLGIVRKSGGEATMLGRPAGQREGRMQVGYLPEGHRIPRHLTGNSALEYYGSLSGLSVAETRRRREELLETVGLSDWGRTSVTKYSKGMLQRLGLAQAMLHDPELLILDEPTDGVDPVGRSDIRTVFRNLKERGKTLFLNSHLLQEVELVCDHVAILNQGELLRVGPIEELTAVADTAEADVTFQLAGDTKAIDGVLPATAKRREELRGGRLQVAVPGLDQPALDRLLDQLRAAKISVHAVNRHQPTLEEVFLELVRSAEESK